MSRAVRSLVIVPAVDGALCYTADLTAADVHEVVGGWLEAVPTDGTITAFCNEEGLLHGLPPNPVASWLLGMYGAPAVVGPVVVQGPVDQYGDCQDVPEFPEALLKSLA